MQRPVYMKEEYPIYFAHLCVGFDFSVWINSSHSTVPCFVPLRVSWCNIYIKSRFYLSAVNDHNSQDTGLYLLTSMELCHQVLDHIHIIWNNCFRFDLMSLCKCIKCFCAELYCRALCIHAFINSMPTNLQKSCADDVGHDHRTAILAIHLYTVIYIIPYRHLVTR